MTRPSFEPARFSSICIEAMRAQITHISCLVFTSAAPTIGALAEEEIPNTEWAMNKVHGKACGEKTRGKEEYCDRSVSPDMCRKAASGQGEPFTTQEDCEGYDADFCENYVAFMCLVEDCNVKENDCSEDCLCCGFTDPTTFPEKWDLPESLCLSRELGGDECNTR